MIFVNRNSELEILKKAAIARFGGANIHLLLYGIRRVGKSRLIDEFLKDKRGFRLDCGSFSRGLDFFRGIFTKLANLEGLSPPLDVEKIGAYSLKAKYSLYERPLDDDILMISEGLELIDRYAKEKGNLIVALDEFHVLIENISLYSREEPYEIMREKILWTIRDGITKSSRNVFWILITSAGFLISEYEKADKAFLEVFQKIEIKPLDKESSKELAKHILELADIKIEESVIDRIAELSGGIPALIEKISFYTIKYKCTDIDCLNKAVLEELEKGDFDDFFIAYIEFISNYLKWGTPTILKVLRAVSEGIRSPKQIAVKTGLKAQTISNILSELKKKEIISERFEPRYPLLREWLLVKDFPPLGSSRRDLIMYSLGITLESYVRELLKSIRKRIVISGEELFLGTVERLKINPIKEVIRHKIIDAIAIDWEGKKLCFEIKTGKISRDEVNRFYDRAVKEGCDAMIVIAKEARPEALIEIGRKGIIFMTYTALRELARAIGFPKINL